LRNFLEKEIILIAKKIENLKKSRNEFNEKKTKKNAKKMQSNDFAPIATRILNPLIFSKNKNYLI